MSKKNTNYYIIICILYIVLIITLYFIFKTKTFQSKHNGEKWFITYGGPSKEYHDAVKRLTQEVNNIQIFDHLYGYTDLDLKNDKEFWDKHGKLAEATTFHRGGYGYWIWKAYLILKTMKTMNENDILLYADAGCTIRSDDQYHTKYDDMMNLVNKCNEKEILFTSTGQIEKHYSKMDLIKYLEMDNTDAINTTQYQATVIFIKKTEKMYRFVNKWYNIMSNNYNLIDGEHSKKYKEIKEYKDSRNDQSVFSLLAKKNGIDESHMFPYEKHDPILISRKRSG